VTLLIDPPNAAGHGRLWSHLASDTSYDELHAFARTLGIPSRGFDRDHYDIPAERYDAVVAAGAVPVSSRELVARLHRAGLRRRKGESLGPRKAGTTLVVPPRLREGDLVAVTAASGVVPPDRLAAGVRVLEGWGLRVRVLESARGVHPEVPYLAGTDAQRAADLTAAWTDPEVRAVFCARGGYGAQRMVDLLDWPRFAAAGPKLLVGFSDVTSLHQAFASRLGLSTVHGPVVTSLGSGDELSREHLRALLLDAIPDASLTPAPGTRVVGGRAAGPLVGGNVAMLASALGTRDAGSARDAVAVLEDVGEETYRLDRLVTHLVRAGWLDGVRGIALGDFTDCGDPGEVRALLAERLGHLGVPVLAGVAVGHEPRNLAFPYGVPAVLDADEGTLTLGGPAVA
jgi:muramoyltetrapeptide carboxypeptidase